MAERDTRFSRYAIKNWPFSARNISIFLFRFPIFDHYAFRISISHFAFRISLFPISISHFAFRIRFLLFPLFAFRFCFSRISLAFNFGSHALSRFREGVADVLDLEIYLFPLNDLLSEEILDIMSAFASLELITVVGSTIDGSTIPGGGE